MSIVEDRELHCSCCGCHIKRQFLDHQDCAACNVLRVLNTAIADHSQYITNAMGVRDSLLDEVITAGGDGEKVRRLFRHLWPKD